MIATADVIAQLGTNKKPGSSAMPGVPYQNIRGLKTTCARDLSEVRANRIAELVTVAGKSVLDLGCNVGTISARLYELGALVAGVDYDDISIDVARQYNPGPSYEVAEINLENIRALGHVDVIVWLSQFNWLVKQRGMDYALDCLWEIGRHCDTLVFESAGVDDGGAPIGYRQDQMLGLLCKNTIFRDIRDHGQWNDHWTPRNVFVCRDPLVRHEGFFAVTDTGEQRGCVVKTFQAHQYATELKQRSAMFLRRLDPSPYFPRFIEEGENSITMSWEGPRATFIPETDMQGILRRLRDSGGITHRDIRPDNLLYNGANTVLVDFAMATFPGEVTNTSHDLGGEYRWPHGFNDEYSLLKSIQKLMLYAQGDAL
mgnify:CR=1 FL=1